MNSGESPHARLRARREAHVGSNGTVPSAHCTAQDQDSAPRFSEIVQFPPDPQQWRAVAVTPAEGPAVMPVVSVNRDRLFEALGQVYCE